jgi:hypothetical protein
VAPRTRSQLSPTCMVCPDSHSFSIVVPLGKYHLRAQAGRSEMFESRGSNGTLVTATETPSSLLEARFSTPLELLVGTTTSNHLI